MHLKSGLIRWVVSLDGDNLLVCYYLSAFEIRPYKMGGLSFKGDNQLVFYYLSAFEIWPDKMGVLSFKGDN